MKEPLIPFNENERLELLHQLNILDSETEEIYDGITYIASQVCQVPISTITLIDSHRQWFKSIVGGKHRENPRIYSFCAHTINEKAILEIPDSRKDERFKDNPLVVGEPCVRFYAGAPLNLKDGLNVGTLCVIDHKPNKLNEKQLKILYYLSLQVTQLLELRLKNSLLTQKQQALDENLNAASLIQKSFLPVPPLKYKGFNIASFWKPANLLGGDIFNVIEGKEKTIFYIIDVCGHDVPSALVTISVSQFFSQHINSLTSLSPKKIIMALDEEYPLDRFDRFFTIFCLVADPITGFFKYSSAAHPPAVVIKKNGECELLNKGGTVIGLNKILPFEEVEGFLEEGDKVFLYTDGIIELKNQEGVQFGADRFYRLLQNLHKEPINIVVQEVYASLRNFNSFFQDDVSLLGFEKVPVSDYEPLKLE